MSIPRVGVIGADQNSGPDQMTAGFQEPVGNRRMVTDYQMWNAFAPVLLDQLIDMALMSKGHHGRLGTLQFPKLRNSPPHSKYEYNSVLEPYPIQFFFTYNSHKIK